MQSLVTPEWHLIVHEKLGEQLYDWVRDPGEWHDAIGTSAGQEVAKQLRERMQGILTRSPNAGHRRDIAASAHDSSSSYAPHDHRKSNR
jgi:hypothetical protein